MMSSILYHVLARTWTVTIGCIIGCLEFRFEADSVHPIGVVPRPLDSMYEGID
jgi:hypothetical protein